MNATRTATVGVYRRARAKAFKDFDGGCAKCGRNAAECHHVYGPTDNTVEHLRPLCYWCHLVAPEGDDYWVWELLGEPGPDRFLRTVAPIALRLHPDVSRKKFTTIATAILWTGLPKHRIIDDLLPALEGIATDRLEGDASAARMFFSLMKMLAKWERSIVGERASDLLQAKKRMGLALGNVSYGHRKRGDELVEDPVEQAAIAKIKELKEEGLSLRKIATEMNAAGWRTRRGTPWRFQYVSAVLGAIL